MKRSNARRQRRKATRPARRAIARVIWDLTPDRLALLLECARDLAEQQRAADEGFPPSIGYMAGPDDGRARLVREHDAQGGKEAGRP